MSGTKVFTVEVEVVEHPEHTEARAQPDLGAEPDPPGHPAPTPGAGVARDPGERGGADDQE